MPVSMTLEELYKQDLPGLHCGPLVNESSLLERAGRNGRNNKPTRCVTLAWWLSNDPDKAITSKGFAGGLWERNTNEYDDAVKFFQSQTTHYKEKRDGHSYQLTPTEIAEHLSERAVIVGYLLLVFYSDSGEDVKRILDLLKVQIPSAPPCKIIQPPVKKVFKDEEPTSSKLDRYTETRILPESEMDNQVTMVLKRKSFGIKLLRFVAVFTLAIIALGFTVGGYAYVFRERVLEIYRVRGALATVEYLTPIAETDRDLYLLGDAYFRLGDFERAEGILHHLIGSSPSPTVKADARFTLGQVSLICDYLEEAEGFLERAERHYKKNRQWGHLYQCLLAQSSVYDNKGLTKEAERALRHADYYWQNGGKEIIPHNALFYRFQYLHLLRTTSLSEAYSAAEKASLIYMEYNDFDGLAFARVNMAFAAALLNDHALAIKNARQADEFFNQSGDYRSRLFSRLVWIALEGPSTDLIRPINEWITMNGDPELKFQLGLALENQTKESSHEGNE